MKLKIGNKEFMVKVASTPEAKTKGLLGVKAGSMPKNAGLVLKYDQATPINITMVGMKFPIDIIFVRNDAVQKVMPADIGDENIVINDVSDFVVEVPQGSGIGIKKGDKVEWTGEKKEDGTIEKAEGGVVAAAEGAMHVLDENGKVQGNIEGDERIFSRKHTEALCSLAEKAFESKSNNDYKKLGMAMMRMIDKQDTQEQEYVKE
jgi:uncharacterized membrane protein (UPF0127 family)